MLMCKNINYCYCYACEIIYKFCERLSQNLCLKQTRKSWLCFILYQMLMLCQLYYYKNIVTICSQQKKQNDVFVVIFDILLYFIKTAMLWSFHTSFAIESWRTMWSNIEKTVKAIDKETDHVINEKINWRVEINNCQIIDLDQFAFKFRINIFFYWVKLSWRRKRAIINWFEI